MLAVLMLNLSGYLIVLLRFSFVAVCALRVLLGMATCGMFLTPFVIGEDVMTASAQSWPELGGGDSALGVVDAWSRVVSERRSSSMVFYNLTKL